MKRKDFLRLIGGGAAVVAAIPFLGLPKKAESLPLPAPIPEPTDEVLGMIYNNKPILGDNIYVGLHKTKPSNASGMIETYENYSRVATPRSEEGWIITAPEEENKLMGVANRKPITFPMCKGKGGIVRWFSIESRDGGILYQGRLTSPLTISAGVTPEFGIEDLTITM
jgi:hypothetical protein